MKLSLCSLAILLALCAHQATSLMKQRCQNIDLILVVDSSGSIGSQDFDLARNAMISLVDQLDIGPDRVRVGFLSYSSHIEVGATLDDRYQDKQSLINQLRAMRYIGGGTDTGSAIAEARRILLASPRKEAPRVAVIFTDGASQNYQHVMQETDLLKKERVDMFSVGIGSGYNLQELDYIASEPKDRYKKFLKDYASLVAEIDSIGETACSASAFIEVNTPIESENVTQNEQRNFQIDVEQVTSCVGTSKRFFRIDFDVTQGEADLVGSYDYVITDKPRTEAVMRMMSRDRDQRNLNTFGQREYFVPYRTDRKRLYISTRAYGENGNSFTFKVTPV